MRVALFFLCLFICNHLVAQWSGVPNTPNGAITCAINTSYPNVGSEVLLGGTFTGPISAVCVKYSNGNGFTAVTGFTPETDTIYGFFVQNNELNAFGRFKIGTKYYGALKIINNNATVNTAFEFKGPFKSFAKIKTVGIDDNNNAMIFGDTLAGMGAGMNGVNLMAAKVANITTTGVVTALPQLKPAHSEPTEKVTLNTIAWDTTRWIILGNFETLGTTQATDAAIYENNNITATNTHPGANLYCRGYAKEFIGWNGTITTSGINSPGLLKLNGATIANVGTGWQTKTLSVTQAQSNIWITGSSTGLDSRIATWSILNSNWIDRQGNLIAQGNTTDSIGGVVFLSGDSVLAYGGFNSNFPGLAVAVITNPPLPVELTSFTGRLINGKAFLQWHTESEKNSLGFKVQRSGDKLEWTEIGFVNSNNGGNTKTPQDYSYWDAKPLQGVSYYRLLQVDTDGGSSYSPIVAVETILTEISLSPNPTSAAFSMKFESSKETVVLIHLLDIEGKVVCKTTFETHSGLNETIINIDNVSSGNYTVQLITENQMNTENIIISK